MRRTINNLRVALVPAFVFGCSGAVCQSATDVAPLPPAASRAVDFDRDIKPIFDQQCQRCHGPEKPKNHFRLDQRAAALKGGDSGVAIVPGNSAESRLIQIVAGMDSEMVMPPKGRGEPLTAEQIGLLRAWIDQGAAWGEDSNDSAFAFTFTPAVGFTTVQGNEAKFREHQWVRDGWRGGLESFELTDRFAPDAKLSITGHLMTDDYRLAGRVEKTDLGFIQTGFEHFRRFDADYGGYVASFNPSIYSLGRDLHLDTGRAWIDFGLTLPDWPRLTLGYEYQYRDGEKATLQWGPVGSLSPSEPDTDAKNIHPAWQATDERTHILKFDAEYERNGWRLADSFRGEWTSWETRRENIYQLVTTTPDVRPTDTARENWNSFQGANTFRVEHEFRDWLYASAGHLYSHLSADADFNLEILNPTGAPLQFPVQEIASSSQQILLERESQVANANLLLGPWRGHALTIGAQAEWTQQHGAAQGFYDTIFTPDFSFLNLHDHVDFLSQLDRTTVDESIAWRFTSLPFTTLFTETRWQQECLGHHEAAEFEHVFDRETDALSDSYDTRVGFDSSPQNWLKLGAHYRNFHKSTTLDDGFADDEPGDVAGYPTFISALARTTHEVESRLTLRPVRWLTTTFTHRLVATDYETTTESYSQDAVHDISPGGHLRAGNYDAQVFSFNTTLTPWRRLYWFTTASYQDMRSRARHDNSQAVVPYSGNIWSVMTHGRYVLNEKTDLTAGYSFSAADFQQDNAIGLPLGMVYDLHGLQAGFVSRRNKNVTLKLQYGFYQYSEPSSGHFNDYTAHAVMASTSWRLP